MQDQSPQEELELHTQRPHFLEDNEDQSRRSYRYVSLLAFVTEFPEWLIFTCNYYVIVIPNKYMKLTKTIFLS